MNKVLGISLVIFVIILMVSMVHSADTAYLSGNSSSKKSSDDTITIEIPIGEITFGSK